MNQDIYNWDVENQRILPTERPLYRTSYTTNRLYLLVGIQCFLVLGLLALIMWLYIRYVA